MALTVFFREPRLTILILALILVDGLAALSLLPRLEDPELSPRAAVITTLLPGASAERVEALVTEPIEEELSEVEEIALVRSSSRPGLSTLTLEVQDDTTNFSEVWSKVRSELRDAEAALPPQASRPEFEEREPKAYAAIVALKWESESPPNAAVMRRYGRELEELLRGLNGTEKVERFGFPREEIQVLLSPEALDAYGLTVGQVAQQLRNSDVKRSAGRLRSDGNELLVELDPFDSLARIGSTVIRTGISQQSVAVASLARLSRGQRTPPDDRVVVEGRPAVVVAAKVISSRRVDQWASQAREALKQFSQRLPTGLDQQVLFDQSRFTEQRLLTLRTNLLLGAALVAVVVFVMMGWRSALAVSMALPLSCLMVLSGMKILGVPIHQMSVTGLIIALGLLIDNAIVVVDEVNLQLDKGLDEEAAVVGTVRHLGVPLLSSTLTTVLAFMPLVLMPGPAGEFVGSISITVILALLGSLFLSLALVPLFLLRFRRLPTLGAPHRFWNAGVHFGQEGYSRVLAWLFRFPVAPIVLSLLVPVYGFWASSQLQEQFFPPSDRAQCEITLELPAGQTLATTEQLAENIRDLCLKSGSVEEIHWYLGRGAATFYYNLLSVRRQAPNYAQGMVLLTPGKGLERAINKLQSELDRAFPEARVLLRQLEQGPPFDAPVEIRLMGSDVAQLRNLGEELRRLLASIPEVTHALTTLSEERPKLELVLASGEADLVQLEAAAIAAGLEDSLDGADGGSVLEATEEIPVRVRLDEARTRFTRLLALPLSPDQRRTLLVQNLGELRLAPDVPVIDRRNRVRVNSVQAFIRAGVLPSVVLNRFRELMEEARFELPPGYTLEVGGESAERNEAVGNLLGSAGALAVLMSATLVLAFRSFRMAFQIGLVAFSSVGLSLAALNLFGYPFGFMAIVGAMGLVGVAINDSIVVLAAIREDEQARTGEPQAMARVVSSSTRHVLTTTLTTMAGFTPLFLDGGRFWPPLAVAIAGGVSGATLLALFFSPAVYRLFFAHSRN